MVYIRVGWNDKSATCSCVPNCFYFVLWSKLAGRSSQTYEKIFSFFSRLDPFPLAFGEVKEWLMLKLQKIIKSVTYSCVANWFSFILWVRLAERSIQSYENWYFFSFFSRLGPFPQGFRQLEEWSILELHKTIRVSHVVLYLIVFTFFDDRNGQGGMFKVTENDHFLVFLTIWVIFPKFLGRWGSGLY